MWPSVLLALSLGIGFLAGWTCRGRSPAILRALPPPQAQRQAEATVDGSALAEAHLYPLRAEAVPGNSLALSS